MTTRDFFQKLEGDRFESFQDLQERVLDEFNRHLEWFPPHYSYLQLIDWAKFNNWIIEDDGYRINVTPNGASPPQAALHS
jgi:hypothetical protein